MDINGWRLSKSQAERYLYMLENKIGCDVTFCVGVYYKKIEAHKFVLTSRSAVFEAMFCNSLEEKTSNNSIQGICSGHENALRLKEPACLLDLRDYSVTEDCTTSEWLRQQSVFHERSATGDVTLFSSVCCECSENSGLWNDTGTQAPLVCQPCHKGYNVL